MYANKKRKKFNSVTLRFNDEVLEAMNRYTIQDGGERAPIFEKVIENFLVAQGLIDSKRSCVQVSNYTH